MKIGDKVTAYTYFKGNPLYKGEVGIISGFRPYFDSDIIEGNFIVVKMKVSNYFYDEWLFIEDEIELVE